jgi:hypothetical protein
MFKPIATLAAAGIVGVILTQLLWLLVAPLLAMAVGAVVFLVKAVFLALMVWLAWTLFKKLTERGQEG